MKRVRRAGSKQEIGAAGLKREWRQRQGATITRLRDVRTREPSQNRFAARLGVKPSIVSDWFSRKRFPTREQLWRIATLYDVSVDWLLGFSVPRERSAREVVGALREDLRGELLKEVRRRLPQSAPPTVEAVLGKADQFWEELCDHVCTEVERLEEQRLRIESQAVLKGLDDLQAAAERSGALDQPFALALLEMKSSPNNVVEPIRSQMLGLGGLQIHEPRSGKLTRRLWGGLAHAAREGGDEKTARWLEALGELEGFIQDREPTAHFRLEAKRRALANLSAREETSALRLLEAVQRAEVERGRSGHD